MYLTRDAIIGADDLNHIELSVPEWGGVVRLRTMTAAEREAYESELNAAQSAGAPTRTIRASLVGMCAVDDADVRLFSRDDVEALATKSSTVLIRLFDACRKLNAMTTGEVDAIEKNSEPQPSDDLRSA